MVRKEQVNLRKTARGASSPAKPALHIPELKPQLVSIASLARDNHNIPIVNDELDFERIDVSRCTPLSAPLAQAPCRAAWKWAAGRGFTYGGNFVCRQSVRQFQVHIVEIRGDIKGWQSVD